ncbi:exported hypothetical protein [uncultured Defluviicoccus sp.]|uniref:Uncharacterized protein n=1 Tax=metagenome TaxID=256318 RepID=A0A380TC32_9ZZZZ|nr:exported hypothetical protein [uncultured Defluviicoccus sp.]
MRTMIAAGGILLLAAGVATASISMLAPDMLPRDILANIEPSNVALIGSGVAVAGLIIAAAAIITSFRPDKNSRLPKSNLALRTQPNVRRQPATAPSRRPGRAPLLPTEVDPPVPGNVVNNPGLDGWSEGETLSNVAPFQQLADGWRLSYGGGGESAINVSRIAAPAGLDGTTYPSPGLRVDASRSGGDGAWFAIESVASDLTKITGRTCRVTFLARASDDVPMSINLVEYFGGDSAQSNYKEGPVVSSAWQRHVIDIDVAAPPDGKIAPDSSMVVSLGLPPQGKFWVEVARLSVVPQP